MRSDQSLIAAIMLLLCQYARSGNQSWGTARGSLQSLQSFFRQLTGEELSSHDERMLLLCQYARSGNQSWGTARGSLQSLQSFFRQLTGEELSSHDERIMHCKIRPCALTQASLAAEVKGSPVSVHIASPGMVATRLLLSGITTARAARAINILAEDPSVVAAWLAPRMRGVSGNGRYFK